MGISCRPLFHKQEHEWKMRLLQTHSHTSERQGHEAGKVRKKKERKEDVALTVLGPQSRCGEKLLEVCVVSPQNETAVLERLRGRKKSSKITAMSGKLKSRHTKKTRRKNNTEEDVKNHTENPAYTYSGNVSCATNEWPDYPDQPRGEAS